MAAFGAQEEALFDWDCFPRPRGRVKEYVKPEAAPVLVIRGFLQPEEVDRLTQAARTSPAEALTWSGLLADLGRVFDFQPFPYGLTGVPDAWRQAEECYDTFVSVQATYLVYEITARAITALQFGPVSYPADDVVASLRILKPDSYSFVRRFTFNPRCCPGRTPQDRLPEFAGLTFRRQIPPVDIERWELRPRLRFRPRLDFDFSFDEETPEGGR